jgi:hypothetical protein
MVREHDPEGVAFEYEDLERSMSNPDEDTLLRAMEDSRRILADYVALGDPTLWIGCWPFWTGMTWFAPWTV